MDNNCNSARFCSSCGNSIDQKHEYCPYCGMDLKQNVPLQNEAQQICTKPVIEPVNYIYKEYISANHGNDEVKKIKGASPLSIVAFILSLISLIPVLNLVTVIPALVCGIIGLVKSKNRKKGLAVASVIISSVLLVATLLVGGLVLLGNFGEEQVFYDYSYYGEEDWLKIGDDYLTIDTNPNDTMNVNDTDALYEIEVVNDWFNFDKDLYDEMLETSHGDGLQVAYSKDDEFMVSWKYDPRYGLEVTYVKNSNDI